MFLYETHLHTSPVSACANPEGGTVRESISFYKEAGYAGVFITNHFIDANIPKEKRSLPYEERIAFFYSDYEEGVRVGKELDFPVFCGLETTHGGTDFLVYGIDKEWCLAHPEIEHMKKSAMLSLMAEAGALIIQAHPFREASYIDHIRLYPHHVHGVEIFNGGNSDFVNGMARLYAENYGLVPFAGSDNHSGGTRLEKKKFGGVLSDTPIKDTADFITRVKNGEMKPFRLSLAEGGSAPDLAIPLEFSPKE